LLCVLTDIDRKRKMARVEVQTDIGEAEIALIMTSDEIKMIVSTWDIPLTVKKSLMEAKKNADAINT
jgi:hypothetical protein